MSSKPILCVCEVDGCGCAEKDTKLCLVVHPDKTTEVMCESCIERNKCDDDYFGIGTLFFMIGDDITNHFL